MSDKKFHFEFSFSKALPFIAMLAVAWAAVMFALVQTNKLNNNPKLPVVSPGVCFSKSGQSEPVSIAKNMLATDIWNTLSSHRQKKMSVSDMATMIAMSISNPHLRNYNKNNGSVICGATYKAVLTIRGTSYRASTNSFYQVYKSAGSDLFEVPNAVGSSLMSKLDNELNAS